MEVSKDASTMLLEEEQILKTVVESLRAQTKALAQQLSGETARARALTSEIVASRRDEEKQLLASDEAVSHALSTKHRGDITELGKQLAKPYFARICLNETRNAQNREIEYRIGIRANPDCRIVDWRKAPVSKLYYEYREGEEYAEEIQGTLREGRIALRNSLEIQDSKLKRVVCRYGSYHLDGQNWVAESGAGSDRPAASVGTLPSVLSLITPDQFRLITEEAGTAVLLQGVAGSGKTSVALHRLAWLLHEENSDTRAEFSVVIVPSNLLRNYVSSTLPSLDVPGVAVLTYEEWAIRGFSQLFPDLVDEGRLRRPSVPVSSSVERLKGSLALLSVLEAGLETARKNLIASLSDSLPWSELPSYVRKVFDEGKERRWPILKLLDELLFSLSRSEQSLPEGTNKFEAILPVRLLLEEKRRGLPDPQAHIIDALKKKREILAADETHLLNDEIVAEALERTAANFELGVGDASDVALLLRLTQLLYGGIHRPDGTFGLLDHLVVDEVQDLSSVQLATIIGAASSLQALTLVGDFHQKVTETSGFSTWDKLRANWAFKDSLSRFVSLNVSHRSTEPIMKLAHAVQGAKTEVSGRPGRAPLWLHCTSESVAVGSAIKWLKTALERYPHALSAVVCRSAADARYVHSLLEPSFAQSLSLLDENSASYAAGIAVVDAPAVKGLEFKNVLIWNPSRAAYSNDPIERNLLYVAITRAEENLSLIGWGAPSPNLPPLNSTLLRGMRISET